VHKPYFFFSITLLASLLTGCAGKASAQSNEVTPTSAPSIAEPVAVPEIVSKNPPASCPLTVPQDPVFVPPEPYSSAAPWENYFWFGSTSLWAMPPSDGIWLGLIHKVFWWREGYIWNEEPEPNLIVTGERLDAEAPLLAASKATNAYASDIGSAMLVGVDFPTPGCWKITGKYQDAELSFVVWVAPSTEGKAQSFDNR
jgi:hypothetical protein